jgi:hypothetical protein
MVGERKRGREEERKRGREEERREERKERRERRRELTFAELLKNLEKVETLFNSDQKRIYHFHSESGFFKFLRNYAIFLRHYLRTHPGGRSDVSGYRKTKIFRIKIQTTLDW